MNNGMGVWQGIIITQEKNMLILEHWLSAWGAFAPGRHLAMSGDISGCDN